MTHTSAMIFVLSCVTACLSISLGLLAVLVIRGKKHSKVAYSTLRKVIGASLTILLTLGMAWESVTPPAGTLLYSMIA